MNVLLAARDLGVSRGDRALLAGFDLTIEPGETLHLRGRNGAGKTSLLEVLAGLRPAASGAVEGVAADRRHWIGHRNALNPDLTAAENLAYWCALQGLDPTPIGAALERMELSRIRRRAIRTFSAGQKRRAALARLLIARRPLWLLDEPLSGLDADGVALFGTLLAEHVAADGAALVTSHQPLPGRLPRVRVLELT